MNLGNIFNDFVNNIAYLERIFERDADDAVEMPDIQGNVTFENVTFAYEEGKEALKDISFTVKAGESVALVGPTGSGKSTIVSLISRFYNLEHGRILIDGQDISKVTLHSLRSKIGIMLQDSFIFSGTIEDNIRYGKLDATTEEIIRVSKEVCADEFINRFENKYQTEVKENGNLPSQGQNS